MKIWIKKCWKIIILILLAIIIFIANILILLFVDKDEGQSAWLTLFSGWVSGIATIALGFIAIIQDRKYKEDADEIELQQFQREWRIEQKEVFKMQLNNLSNIYNDIQNHQFSKIIDECIYRLKDNPNTIVDIAYSHTIKNLYDRLMYVTVNFPYYFDGTDELLKESWKYISNLMKHIDNLENYLERGDADFLDELYNQFTQLIEQYNGYLTKFQLFISFAMTNGKPQEIQDKLNEMNNAYNIWQKQIKAQLKQTQNNK